MSRTIGTRSWQQLANYPKIGLALLYGQSGAALYIGHVAAILPFVNFQLYETGGITANLRMAVGPGWVPRRSSTQKQITRTWSSASHLNACLNLVLSTEMRLLPHTYLDLGFSFTHLSNGSFTLPNLGLNIPAMTVGLRYDLFPEQKRLRQSLPPLKKKINYYLYSFVAGKQSLPLESAVYLVNIFNAEVLKDFARNGRFGGGINMTLDRANSVQVPYSPTFAFDRSMCRTGRPASMSPMNTSSAISPFPYRWAIVSRI